MIKSYNNKTRWVFIGVNSFFYISMSVYAPFLAAYYVQQGVTSTHIGILLAIGPVITILIQPKWAKISDLTGKRKTVLALAVLGACLSILLYYLGNGFLGFFIVTLIFSCFSTALLPLCDSIIVPLSEKYNFNYAHIRMGGTIGYSITVFIAGTIIKRYPKILFAMGSIMYFLLLLIVLYLPKDKKINKIIVPVNKERKKFVFEKIFQTKEAYFILAFAFIFQLGMSFALSFLSAYVNNLGYSQSVIGLANSISAFSEIPILLFINKLVKKFGIMKIVAFSCFMTGIRILCISSGVLTIILFSQILQSVTYMTMYFCCVTYISQNVISGKQAQGQGLLAKLQIGVAGTIGFLGGGYILNYIDYQKTYFLFGIVVFILGTINYIFYLIYKKRTSVKKIYA